MFKKLAELAIVHSYLGSVKGSNSIKDITPELPIAHLSNKIKD